MGRSTGRLAEKKWAPGGWQPAAYHRDSKRLFVLMDQRAKWAHTSESREVWVFDTENRKQVKTIHLPHEACCIGVDQNSKDPHIYALSSHGQSLDIVNVESGNPVGHVDELGHEPRLVVLPDGAPQKSRAHAEAERKGDES